MNFQNVMQLGPSLQTPRSSRFLSLARGLAIIAAFAGQISNAHAADFLTANKAKISGEIIRFTHSTVTIRPNVGSMIILAPNDIEQLHYALSDGSTIEGRLHGWHDGIYVIDVGGRLVSVRDGAIESEQPSATKTAPAMDQKEFSASNNETEDSSATTAITEADAIEITAKVDITSEAASFLVFNISLSKQADDNIVLLYTTVDGTAKAGEDYEEQNGALLLPAGTLATRLEMRLINDDEVEQDETLSLFLSAAPTAATITQRKILATIRDDDR